MGLVVTREALLLGIRQVLANTPRLVRIFLHYPFGIPGCLKHPLAPFLGSILFSHS